MSGNPNIPAVYVDWSTNGNIVLISKYVDALEYTFNDKTNIIKK